jgi:hypothetical protein
VAIEPFDLAMALLNGHDAVAQQGWLCASI